MKAMKIAGLALLFTVPAAAQEKAAPTPYERALAAGYKALMACGAVASAERAGGKRTVGSIYDYEFQGVYPNFDPFIRDLVTFEYRDGADGPLYHFAVEWDDAMPPRVAINTADKGCSVMPIGFVPDASETRVNAANEPTPAGLNAGSVSADTAALKAVVETTLEPGGAMGGVTTGLVVVRGGKIVSEAYIDGFGPKVPQRTWSVAKSIAATLVGAAVQRGEIDVMAPAQISAWQVGNDPRSAITVDNLLRMASGRYSDTAGNRTDPIYWGGATVDERAITWPIVNPPGTVFRYANNDTLAAVKAIQPGFAKHPPAELFAELGMDSTVAETDWQGNYVLSSQVWSTARDLAQLGQLYLADGVWKGRRILPEGWRSYISAPDGPQPEGELGYGAGFWLFNNSAGIPADTFVGIGNRGQYLVVVPSLDTVIVRRGEDPVGNRFDIAEFTREILAALAK